MSETTDTATPPREVRKRKRTASYFKLGGLVVLLALFVIWVLSNNQRVEVEWLVSSTDGPLSVLLLIAAVIGWILGILTAFIVRRRARKATE